MRKIILILTVLISVFAKGQDTIPSWSVEKKHEVVIFMGGIKYTVGANNGYTLVSDSFGNLHYALSPFNGWGLTGNAGTNPSVNSIGTTDSNSLIFTAEGNFSGAIDVKRDNTIFGFNSGSRLYLDSSSVNSVFGSFSLGSIQHGGGNSVLGYDNLENLTNGNNNIGIGVVAGNTVTTGSNNIFMGESTGTDSANAQYDIVMGYGAIAHSNSAMVLGHIDSIVLSSMPTGAGYVLIDNQGTGSFKAQPASSIFDSTHCFSKLRVDTIEACSPLTFRGASLTLIINDTVRFIIDTVGNVGIGTTTPSTTFQAVHQGVLFGTSSPTILSFGDISNSPTATTFNKQRGGLSVLSVDSVSGDTLVFFYADAATTSLQTSSILFGYSAIRLPDSVSSTNRPAIFGSSIISGEGKVGNNTFLGNSNFGNVYLWGGKCSIIGNIFTSNTSSVGTNASLGYCWLHDNCHVDSNYVSGNTKIWGINDADAEDCYVRHNYLSNSDTANFIELDDIMQRKFDHVDYDSIIGTGGQLAISGITQLGHCTVNHNKISGTFTHLWNIAMMNSAIDSNKLSRTNSEIGYAFLVNSNIINATNTVDSVVLINYTLNKKNDTTIQGAKVIMGCPLQVIDGTQGANKIFTSNATGSGSWQINTLPLDSAQISALSPVQGQTYYCTNCMGNAPNYFIGGLVSYTGSLWRRNY